MEDIIKALAILLTIVVVGAYISGTLYFDVFNGGRTPDPMQAQIDRYKYARGR